ncbi:MAG: DUF4330 family protein [Clostridia bacterium]|nr:DUF4330 family protein [Clostridia bacterium]
MKTKFNIIDLVILIIIVAIIAVGCIIYFNMTNDKTVVETNTTKIEFVVEVRDVSEDAANSFIVGDLVTFGESTSGRGVISDVEVVPYKKWVNDMEDGEVIISEVPGRYTANVTISADVTKSNIAYTSGSEEVAVGKKMPFNAKGAAFEEGYIINLIEVK